MWFWSVVVVVVFLLFNNKPKNGQMTPNLSIHRNLMITNWLTSITGQLFGYLNHTMWWILMLFKHLYMPYIIWMWPSKEVMCVCDFFLAHSLVRSHRSLEIHSHCCVLFTVLFTFIASFIEYISNSEDVRHAGRNSFMVLYVRSLKRKQASTRRVRKGKHEHNASE